VWVTGCGDGRRAVWPLCRLWWARVRCSHGEGPPRCGALRLLASGCQPVGQSLEIWSGVLSVTLAPVPLSTAPFSVPPHSLWMPPPMVAVLAVMLLLPCIFSVLDGPLRMPAPKMAELAGTLVLPVSVTGPRVEMPPPGPAMGV